jgi:hypothetical protein
VKYYARIFVLYSFNSVPCGASWNLSDNKIFNQENGKYVSLNIYKLRSEYFNGLWGKYEGMEEIHIFPYAILLTISV